MSNTLPSFTDLLNLADEKLGAKALTCSDDFFASMDNLVKPGRGVFIEGKYTENGKWMDGWESRRKRTPGHDWCILQLGATGIIKGIDIDTNHFLGNHPPHASIEACYLPEGDIEQANWQEILPKSPLQPGSQHFFEIDNSNHWTHLKLNIYPDGGVARLKVYGEVKRDWNTVSKNELLDLASALNGGKPILCNDMFFSQMGNLLMPNRGVDMGDGWKTKRNRIPNNHDWVIIRLAHEGRIKKITVDTCHFKGNYPDSCLIEGANTTDNDIENANWTTILSQTKLSADKEHFYEKELVSQDVFTHIRLNIFPDGGVSRLRLWGHIVKKKMTIPKLNELPKKAAFDEISKCCGATNWVNNMVAARPFKDENDLLGKADKYWSQTTEADGLEAFTHHPKIGDISSLEKKFANTKTWAGNEQKGVATATKAVIEKLAKGNKDYEDKFGFIFIVCATGKSADEMLTLLQARLPNEREDEIKIAMAEQHKITKIRLTKLIS